MDKLTPEELQDYHAMLAKQRNKPILKTGSKEPLTPRDLITQAYIYQLCLQRGISLQEAVNVPSDLKEFIYRLYIAGVLPLRLGGVNL